MSPLKCPRLLVQLLAATVFLWLATSSVAAYNVVSIENSNWNPIFHQVAIRVRQPVLDKTEDYHLCSGLILDPFYVVTSAKCLNL